MPAFFAPLLFELGVNAGTALIVGEFLGSAGLLLGGLALSYTQQKRAKRKARDQFNAAQQDRLVNISSTVAPRDLVLGRVRKGGAVFFRGSTGPNKTTFVMCVALAGHEIDAVEAVYLNDVPVTLDGSGNVTTAPYMLTSTGSDTFVCSAGANVLPHTPVAGSSPNGYKTSGAGIDAETTPVAGTLVGNTLTVAEACTYQYQYLDTAYNANIRAVLGTAGQAADARMMALFPGVWTAAHKASGVAYLICEFQYNETSFPTGLPVATAVIRGAKVYDPRTTLTAWSQNPALHKRHVYQHAAFGKATITTAEDARFTTAANVCDTSTNYVVAGVTQTNPLYRSALVIPFGAGAKDVFDDLAQCMAGSWAFAGGELYLKAGTFTASVMSLTEADLAVVQRNGATESQIPIGIAVHKERAQKFNTVNVSIWDAAQDYKQVTLTPLTSSALVTRDGAALAQAVTYPAIPYAPQALHVAGVMMRDARDPLTVVLPWKLKAYPLELFDTIDLTISRYGWSAKLFTILARDWSNDGSLKLTLKETAASIFTLDAAFSAQGGAANTSMPSPWFVATVEPLTVTSGTAELTRQADGTVVSRMRVSWPLPTDSSVTTAGTVEVQYRAVLSAGAWTSVQVAGNETQVLIADVADNEFYVIRARARNRLAVGDWGAQVVHQVIGKSELPTTVTGVATTQDLALWTPVTDLDLSGYEIRAIPGTTATWALGVPLHSGLVTSTPYAYIQRLTGVQTIMVAARDTSGLYGVHGSATLDFGTIDSLNVAQSYDYAAAGFPGPETTNATVSGTDLLADADPASDWWAVGPDWWGYGGGSDFYGGSLYLEAVYIATFAPTYTGGFVILDTTLIGAPASVEWRVDGALLGDFWESGGADFWAGTVGLYGDANSWQPYIGEVASTAGVTIQWRVTIGAGPVQGQITDMAVRLQMPQIAQSFTGLAIDAGGTRLTPANGSPAQTWISVEQVDFTVYVDGSGAIAGRVLDFDAALGPLVQTINAAGTAVSSTGQAARVSGF